MRVRRALGPLLVVAGAAAAAAPACGSFGAAEERDADAAAEDGGAAPDATGTADASGGDAPAGACDPTKPFAGAVLVPGLNTDGDEMSASFSPDERTVYLARNPAGLGGKRDIFVGQRVTADAPFGSLVPLAEVNSNVVDDNPSVRADGLVLVLHSQRGDAGTGPDLYIATRMSQSAPFSTPVPLAKLNTIREDVDPFLSPDGTRLYFAQGTDTAAKIELFVATPDADGNFANAMVLDELAGGGADDAQPVVRADGLEIFFASDRPGTAGDYDVWHATRASPNLRFDAPSRIGEVSGTGIDVPAWVSPDGCRLYLSSERGGGIGGRDIWMATRRP